MRGEYIGGSDTTKDVGEGSNSFYIILDKHLCNNGLKPGGFTATGYVESKVSGQKFNKLKAPLDIVQTIQFPKALQLLALATEYGHLKYEESDSEYLNFKNVQGGSQTYNDASARHATDRKGVDIESGLHHIIHEAWNKLASLELWAEENNVNVGEYSKDYLEKLKQ